MSKTVEELREIYKAAMIRAWDGRHEDDPCPTIQDEERAGIRAVVEALRDEIVEDVNCKYCVATTAMYNEILGDVEEKATTDAIQSFEGENNDFENRNGKRRIQEILPTTQPGRDSHIEQTKGSSDRVAHNTLRVSADTRNFSSKNEAGRSGNVGREINHTRHRPLPAMRVSSARPVRQA